MASREVLRHLSRTREFIAENFARPLTLDDLAREADYSPFHLHRLFVEAYGETPNDFLRRTRLTEAKRLLARSQISVLEACAESGYQSPTTFSRLFAREFGAPPTAFRRVVQAPNFGPLRLVPSCFLF
jgi:AraC-like DNA-binding protein